MNTRQFIQLLKKFAADTPEYAQEAKALSQQLQSAKANQRDDILLKFFQSHRDFHNSLIAYTDCSRPKESVPDDTPPPPKGVFTNSEPLGKQFPVYGELPSDLIRRLENAQNNDHLKSWAEAVSAIPKMTTPLPHINGAYIRQARAIWEGAVCGNEEILRIMLRHAVEYGKTGQTAPILLYGPPGIGKTLIAKTYSSILNLPCIQISAASSAITRGLAGAPTLYTGAGAGAIAQAMINAETGNPVIFIDEIDKTVTGHTGSPDLQNELLSALDDSNTQWHDNYLEMHLDISHIPFVFTANDISRISQPLLDRMEVIRMEPPTKETIYAITQKHFIPRIIRKYDTDQVHMGQAAVNALVDQFWKSGLRSCRPYQDAVSLLISDAYLNALETEQPVKIQAEDVQLAVKQFCTGTAERTIGFRTA